MIEHYLKRGYPFKQLKKLMLRACKFTQDELLDVKTKEPTNLPIMTTRFNPTNPDIKKFIHESWNIIDNSNDCSQTFSKKPIVGFKRLQNLRDILTKASISYPPPEIETRKIIPAHCTRLGKCTYCPIIKKVDVTCKVTGRKFHTIDLPNQLSCELSDIVYLVTCSKSNKYYVGETGRPFRARIYEHKLSVSKDSRITPVSKHFTEQGHSVRNMQFSILEWCSPKYNTPKQVHRKRHEQWWMWNIGAIHPIGINQFI